MVYPLKKPWMSTVQRTWGYELRINLKKLQNNWLYFIERQAYIRGLAVWENGNIFRKVFKSQIAHQNTFFPVKNHASDS